MIDLVGSHVSEETFYHVVPILVRPPKIMECFIWDSEFSLLGIWVSLGGVHSGDFISRKGCIAEVIFTVALL